MSGDRDRITRPDSRTMPFSLGGAGDRSAGALIPEGPDVLYNVSPHAPDVAQLPWERRVYDAWTTPEFRALVLTWLADMITANPWIYRWRVRERATQARLSVLRLRDPLLVVVVRRRSDGREFETSISWTARERDDAALVQAKLAEARITIETLHAQNPV
jgi:hypothetical protein